MADNDRDQFLRDHFGIDVNALRGNSSAGDDSQSDGGGQTAASAASTTTSGDQDNSNGENSNSGTVAASSGSGDGQDQDSGTSDTTQTTDSSSTTDTTNTTDATDTTETTDTTDTDRGGTSDNSGITDNGDVVPDGPGGGLAPGCTEQPTYVAKTPVPVTINADTLPDFIARSNEALGGFPHCNIDVAWAPDGDDQGKITRANITVTTEIIRPRLGMNRANDRDLAIMQKAVALIQQHEEHHRDIVRQIYATSPCALVGKTSDRVDAIMKTYSQQHDGAQAAYDKQFGQLVPVYTDGQITDVQLGPT